MSKFSEFFKGPQADRSYSDLDPQSKQYAQEAFQATAESPESIANKQMQAAQGAEGLLATPEQMNERDLRLGMGGQDAFNQAIAARSRDVFGRDLDRLRLASRVGAFDTASTRMQSAQGRVAVQNAVQQGAAQRRAEYDAARKKLRQDAINSAVGNVATVAGYIAGGAAGGTAANQATKPAGQPPGSTT